MGSRDLAFSALASALLVPGLVLLAPPANAQSLSIDCSDYALGSTVSTSADPGETIAFTLVNCSTGSSPFLAPYTAGITTPQFTGVSITTSPQIVTDYSITAGTPDGTYTNVFRLYDGLAPTSFEIYISVTVPRASAPTDAATVSAPPGVQQQVGRSETATCDEDGPVDLNWAGVGPGGWSESWAGWMNGGAGGFVCTRTLVYSTSQAKWVVN